MPLEPSFAQAIFHDLPRNYDSRDPWSNHRVLGLRLRPFSLWHLALLQEIDSPLLIPLRKDEPCAAGPRDLARAVRICRLRWPQIDWKGDFDLRVLCALLGGFTKHLAAFAEYVKDFQASPEYIVIPPERNGNEPPRAPRGAPPAILRTLREVIQVTGCSRSDAWDMPVGEARWWYAIADNERFECDFMTQVKRDEQARIKKENPELWEQLRTAAAEYAKTHGN